jgi:hypothetical protein
LRTIIVFSVLLVWSSARAEEAGDGDRAAINVPATTLAASVGRFLPFSQAPSTVSQRAQIAALGGYDGARRTATFETTAEVTIWGPLAIRGGAVYRNADNSLRPSLGLRAQVLREQSAGLDGSVGVFYRPEGLTEPEGEIETVVSLGRHAGRSYLLASLLYGQDGEGKERDGEIRLAAIRPLGGRFIAGLDGRLRLDLGSDRAVLRTHGEASLDLLVGPVALLLDGGASAVKLANRTSTGAFVLSGIGASF